MNYALCHNYNLYNVAALQIKAGLLLDLISSRAPARPGRTEGKEGYRAETATEFLDRSKASPRAPTSLKESDVERDTSGCSAKARRKLSFSLPP